MNVTAYRKYRKEGINVATAMRLATSQFYVSEHEVFNNLSPDATVTGKAGDWDVRVRVSYDEDVRLGEDDVTGFFTDEYTPGCIRNRCRNWGTDYKWYHPSNYDLNELPKDGSTKGMSKQVAAEYVAARIRKAMSEDADRSYVMISLYVSREGIELGEAHLGWIDIGSGDDENYLARCCDDLLAEAVDEAELALFRLKTRT